MRVIFSLAAASLIALTATAYAAQASPEAVAADITKSIESFYGKPIDNVNAFLAREYGVKGPLKQEGSRYVYMLPATNSLCGELTLDTTGNTISGWQTITWERSDEHQPGRACDKAFKEKLGKI